MTIQTDFNDFIRPVRADILLASLGLTALRALRKKRAERSKRIAAWELDRSLRAYPDYLLRDMGFTRSRGAFDSDREFHRF